MPYARQISRSRNRRRQPYNRPIRTRRRLVRRPVVRRRRVALGRRRVRR